jgi:PAS domain S-box-containing protein
VGITTTGTHRRKNDIATEQGFMKSSIRTKLIGGLAVLFLWMVAVELVSIYATGAIENRLRDNVQCHIDSANLLTEVRRKAELVHAKALLYLTVGSMEDMIQRESEIRTGQNEIGTLLDSLQDTCPSQGEHHQLAEFRLAWNAYSRIWDEQILPMHSENRKEQAFALVKEDQPGGIAARTAFDKLEGLHKASTQSFHDSLELANQERARSRNTLFSMKLVATIFGLAFGSYVGSQIGDTLKFISNIAQLAAAGDLDWSVTVKSGDEIESVAESINRMTRKAKKVLAARRETAEQLQRQIRERKHIAGMLAAEKNRLATALRLIDDGVIVTDSESNIVLINQEAAKLTGWPQKQVTGKPLGEVFHIMDETTGRRCQNLVEKELRGGNLMRLANHTLLIARNGAERTIAHSSAPIRDGDGEIIGVVLVFRQAREHVKTEERAERQLQEVVT